MTAVDVSPTLGWRSLKEIVAHYMEDSIDSSGRSGAEVIRACFREIELCKSLFAARGDGANDRLQYENDLLELNELIEKTRARILRLVSQQAEEGKWICLGRRHPDAEHEVIPSRYWAFLTMDVDNNAVTGDGILFRDLRCRLSKDVAEDDLVREVQKIAENFPQSEQQSSPVTPSPPLAPDAPKVAESATVREPSDRPGRPSDFHLVRQEFDRRRTAGLLEPSLRKQADALAKWFVETHRDLRPYRAKTIANRLRAEFRQVPTSATIDPK